MREIMEGHMDGDPGRGSRRRVPLVDDLEGEGRRYSVMREEIKYRER